MLSKRDRRLGKENKNMQGNHQIWETYRITAAADLDGESEIAEKGLGLGLLMHLYNICSKFDYSTQ